jgi:hypothetical protein
MALEIDRKKLMKWTGRDGRGWPWGCEEEERRRRKTYPYVFAGGEEELDIFLQFEELLGVLLNAWDGCTEERGQARSKPIQKEETTRMIKN